ncbi:molybdopterin biosynthesis protein [Desulfocurvus sp. DL9XJH121]
MARKIYLHMKPLQEAQQVFWTRFSGLETGSQAVASREACGRVTAGPVRARFSSPSFSAAAMDGLAVRAEETFGASDDTPLTLRLDEGQAVMVNTGHPLPDGKNAVLMIENVLLGADGAEAVIRAPAFPWQHVRKIGEDIVATELLFPSGHLIRPADIGALLTAGCAAVEVRKRPTVAVLPTGSELVDLDDHPDGVPPGKTVESNATVLAEMARQAGAELEVEAVIPDDFETIAEHVRAAASRVDMVIVNAGSSAGSADHTAGIIEQLGEVLVHGVTIMPGKPTILGDVGGTPVVGVPGYPVSAVIAMEQLVLPLLRRMQGLDAPEPDTVRAVLAKDLPSRVGIEEFRRMVVGRIGEAFVAAPLKQGAGSITTLTRANGIFRIPASSEGEVHGQEADIELLVPRRHVERTILCTGSHDLCLDVLDDRLRQRDPAHFLASTHVGSLGGIMALKQGMCHIAGSHLLDPDDGSYNQSYVRRYLAGRDIRIVTLVHREQGFIVRKGNPAGIAGITDLLREDMRLINRQAGSGTRVLLDFELSRNGLDPDGIRGYGEDEYTHMAVAVAVLSGKADVGMGIKSAANALGLDFIPVVEERYDLLIPGELYESSMVQAVLDVIGGQPFKEAVEGLGGYSTRETGRLVPLD